MYTWMGPNHLLIKLLGNIDQCVFYSTNYERFHLSEETSIIHLCSCQVRHLQNRKAIEFAPHLKYGKATMIVIAPFNVFVRHRVIRFSLLA